MHLLIKWPEFILQAKMAIFGIISKTWIIPTIEDLHKICQTIYKRYAHPTAFEEALNGTYHDPASRVEVGDMWSSPKEVLSPNNPEQPKSKGRRKKTQDCKSKKNQAEDEFKGDQVLVQTCRLIYDGMLS